MDLGHLEALRDERNQHQHADAELKKRLYECIRQLPATVNKVEVEKASGVSRPTIYRLLDEGAQRPKPRKRRSTR
ncbi:hypothetical protein [Mycobacteroides abscessus]|uniref:hypothetical protein n=1 Tax=Mycobacteroides abscessus TaxID=36809 RepID=UPI0009A84459|nr:hypothetical protein [Mycobacteroides abscessus]